MRAPGVRERPQKLNPKGSKLTDCRKSVGGLEGEGQSQLAEPLDLEASGAGRSRRRHGSGLVRSLAEGSGQRPPALETLEEELELRAWGFVVCFWC